MICKSSAMGGKAFLRNSTFPSLPKADLRRDITAWGMLVWAYRDEKAHMATNADAAGLLGPRMAMTRLEGGKAGGLINARLDAHEDAVVLDAMAIEWFGWPGRDRLVKFAEKGVAPPCAIVVERLRLGPAYDDRGRMVLIYPERGRHEAIACLVDYHGTEAAKAEAREREWVEWHGLLMAFHGALARRRFRKWRVMG